MQKFLQNSVLGGILLLLGCAVVLAPRTAAAQSAGGEGYGGQGVPDVPIVEDQPEFNPEVSDVAGFSDLGSTAVQASGDLDADGTPDAVDHTPDASYNEVDPVAFADDIVDDFDEALAFCQAISPREYVVDCLSERMATIAEKLPETGEFADMRTALRAAAEQLEIIAVQNQSAVLPTGVARSTGENPTVTTRPLRPVATESLAASLQAADAVIAQTQLVLLRSSSGTQARSLAFQRVAAVVGTTRTLLRST